MTCLGHKSIFPGGDLTKRSEYGAGQSRIRSGESGNRVSVPADSGLAAPDGASYAREFRILGCAGGIF